MFAWVAQLVEHFPEEEGVAGSSPAPSTCMARSIAFDGLFSFLHRHERRLSTLVFVGGFVLDILTFSFLELPAVTILFSVYVGVAALSTITAHALMSSAKYSEGKLALLASLIAQFTIGGLLSGFLIFYTKSATLSISWPFLLLVALVFLGNEYFSTYRTHLVFQTVLFFFALYAFVIFALPLYVGTLGARLFLYSTGISIAVFLLYAAVLSMVGKERLHEVRTLIFGGVAAIVFAVTGAYFTGLVPPIPLTLKDAGIYYDISHANGGYTLIGNWKDTWWNPRPVQVAHVAGTPLSAYSAIFAPGAFTASIIHRWQRYDEAKKEWITQSMVSFPLSGGRGAGYRGYSIKDNPSPGKWRVLVETSNGQVVGKISFTVYGVSTLPAQKTVYK